MPEGQPQEEGDRNGQWERDQEQLLPCEHEQQGSGGQWADRAADVAPGTIDRDHEPAPLWIDLGEKAARRRVPDRAGHRREG